MRDAPRPDPPVTDRALLPEDLSLGSMWPTKLIRGIDTSSIRPLPCPSCFGLWLHRVAGSVATSRCREVVMVTAVGMPGGWCALPSPSSRRCQWHVGNTASAPPPSHIHLGADPSMLHTKPLNARPRQLLRYTHRTSTGAALPGSTRSAGGCPTGTDRSWAFARTSGCPWLSAWPPPPGAIPSLPLRFLRQTEWQKDSHGVVGAPTSHLEHPTCRYLVVGLDITVPGPSPSRGERGRLSALPGIRAPTRHGCL